MQPKRHADQQPPPLDATDFTQELVELRQLLQGLVRSVAALGEEIAAVDRRVVALRDLADAFDGNPELREFLSAGAEARRMAMQVLRVVTQRGGLSVAPASAAEASANRKSRRIAKRA